MGRAVWRAVESLRCTGVAVVGSCWGAWRGRVSACSCVTARVGGNMDSHSAAGWGGKQESDRVYPLRSYRVLARGVRGQLLSQE